MTRNTTTTFGLQAATLAVVPVVLLPALVWHPYLPGRLPNNAAVADAVVADPTRWGLAHLAAGVGLGAAILAFIAIRGYLRATGEDRWSGMGLVFVVIGSILHVLLPGMEFAPLAAVETGADPEAAQAALAPWFIPVLVSGGILFAVGALAFARGILRSGVLSPGLATLVTAGLIALAVSRLLPLAAAQLYLQALAALVAMWPLAYHIWRQPQPAHQPRPLPTT